MGPDKDSSLSPGVPLTGRWEDMQPSANRGMTAFPFPGHFERRAFARISATRHRLPNAACIQTAQKSFRDCLKNATEGVAASPRIFVFTALLLAGHVLPFALLILTGVLQRSESTFLLALAGSGLSLAPRIAAAIRFRQPSGAALLHPWAILVFLALQWYAFARSLTGTPATWKGRTYLRT